MPRTHWVAWCAIWLAAGCAREARPLASPGAHAAPAAPPAVTATSAGASTSTAASVAPATPAPQVSNEVSNDEVAAPIDAAMAEVLSAASGLKAIAMFRGDRADAARLGDRWRIVSAVADDGRGASCLATAGDTRCVDFAGYGREHLIHVFARERYRAVPVPAWAQRLFAMHAGTGASEALWHDIEVYLEGAEPVLGIHDDDGVRFAVRRAGRWRVSDPFSGGKSLAPFYFGSLDLSAVTEYPAIGVVIGGYMKEACVRFEQDELVVLEVGDALVERGRAVIGAGLWIWTSARYAPFDPKDPNHYAIRLAPRVERGQLQLDVAARHTPRKLRARPSACGLELNVGDVDRVLALVGRHKLDDLVRASLDEEP